MTTSHDDDVCELLESLEIDSIKARHMAGGVWVNGTISEHRFEALVFPEHAENSDYELDDSRISKLWVQRISDRATVANFDRGWDVRPTTPIAGQIVTVLAEGVAGVAFQD